MASGRLHLEFFEDAHRRSIALGHQDLAKAKEEADKVAAGLCGSSRTRDHTELTLGELFDIYLREVTPGKGEQKRSHDRRTAELWLEVVPATRRADSLISSDAEAFINYRKLRGDLRRGRGGIQRSVPIRPRSWRADLAFLKAALRWGKAQGMLTGDPGILYFRDRTKAEVRRPVLKGVEVSALLKAARTVGRDCHDLLVLVHETGHRVGAVRQLRWSDVDLVKATVHWRPELDKIGFDHTTPLSSGAIGVLRVRLEASGAIGDAPIFRAPKSPSRPASRDLVRDWWDRMEAIAQLPGRERRGWHALRRKFASDMKAHPVGELAALGGWKDFSTIHRCYQIPDPESMREALAGRRGSLHQGTAEGTAEVLPREPETKRPRLTLKRGKAVS